MSTSWPVLRSRTRLSGPDGLPRSIASPTSRSTGLVNAGEVLFAGHRAGTPAAVVVAAVVLVCQRIAPTRQAEDLVDAQAGEQPQQRDSADELERIPRRAGPAWLPCLGRSPRRGSARPTSAWPRPRRRSRAGQGRSAPRSTGDPSARRGSNRRSIHSHSCRSQKNVAATDQVTPSTAATAARRSGRACRSRSATLTAPRPSARRRSRSTRRRARGPSSRVGAVRVLGVQPAAGLDQRVVGVRAAERPSVEVSNHRRVQSSHSAGNVDLAGLAARQPLLPRRLGRERHSASTPMSTRVRVSCSTP